MMKLNERIIKWLNCVTKEQHEKYLAALYDKIKELVSMSVAVAKLEISKSLILQEESIDRLIGVGEETAMVIGKLAELVEENRERIQALEAPATEPEEPASGELFDPDPKLQPYPTHWNGLRVGYVTVKEDVALCLIKKDNTLYPYENASWASNTLGKRITVKASRPATMVYAYGGDKHYDLPWPTEFDGGTRAYLVMNEQLIDGHDLTSFEHPKLYIKAADVAESWVVEVVG